MSLHISMYNVVVSLGTTVRIPSVSQIFGFFPRVSQGLLAGLGRGWAGRNRILIRTGCWSGPPSEWAFEWAGRKK